MRKIILLLAFSFLFVQIIFSQDKLPKRATGGVCNSKAIYLAQPAFSVKTENKKFSGSVYVRIKIDKEGNVSSAKATSGSSFLHKESEESALKSTFQITRLTNGFSKKWENLRYALALHFAYYNFCRIHKTIRCTPAMEAGITKTVWSIKDLIGINGA